MQFVSNHSINPKNEKKTYSKLINTLLADDEFLKEKITDDNFVKAL